MKHGLFLTELLLIIAISTPTIAAGRDPLTVELPELRIPEEIQAEWVAEKIAINGLPMSIRVFHTTLSAVDVINLFERRWRIYAASAYRREDAHDELGIVMEHEGYFHRVVAKDAVDGSEGSITVSPLPLKYQPDLETEFPLPIGTVLISKVESLDNGIRAETLTAANNDSVYTNIQKFRLALAAKGWEEHSVNAGADAPGRAQLIFQKNKNLSQITVTNATAPTGHGTMVLINWAK